jgi:hypothetical protein
MLLSLPSFEMERTKYTSVMAMLRLYMSFTVRVDIGHPRGHLRSGELTLITQAY